MANNKFLFANWIVEKLKETGWSQADLARAANVSRAAISDVINGKRNAGPDLCNAIARALKLPSEEVFREAGLLPPKPENDPRLEEINYILSQLPEAEREDIIEYAKMRLQLSERRGGYVSQRPVEATT